MAKNKIAVALNDEETRQFVLNAITRDENRKRARELFNKPAAESSIKNRAQLKELFVQEGASQNTGMNMLKTAADANMSVFRGAYEGAKKGWKETSKAHDKAHAAGEKAVKTLPPETDQDKVDSAYWEARRKLKKNSKEKTAAPRLEAVFNSLETSVYSRFPELLDVDE